MSAGSAIRRGQAAAEREMTLTLRAYEPNGTTTDADDFETQSYEDRGLVAGKVQSPSSQGRDTATRYVTVGDVERPVWDGGLHIPICSDLPKAGHQRGQGWEYEVEDIGENDDLALLGRRFLVYDVPAKSKATARRLDVVEVTP